jgi:ketosteroid isomerase-like protein
MMRAIVCLLAIMLMASCSSGVTGAATPSPSEADLLAMATQIDSALDVAYNNRDIDGFMKHYLNSSDLVVVDGGKFLKGYVAWRQEIERQFKEVNPKVRFYLSEKHNIVKGDHVYGWGYYKVLIPVENAPDKVVNGLYTSVKAFQGGKLVTVMETYVRTAGS